MGAHLPLLMCEIVYADATVREVDQQLLRAACVEGAVDEMLAAGADVHATTIEGNTALHLALWSCCPSNVRALVAAGADPTHCNSSGKGALYIAADWRPDLVRLLLAAGADPRIGSDLQTSPILVACNRHALHPYKAALYEDAVRALAAAGAPVDEKALLTACGLRNGRLLRLLIEELGAVPTVAVFEAACERRIEEARLLAQFVDWRRSACVPDLVPLQAELRRDRLRPFNPRRLAERAPSARRQIQTLLVLSRIRPLGTHAHAALARLPARMLGALFAAVAHADAHYVHHHPLKRLTEHDPPIYLVVTDCCAGCHEYGPRCALTCAQCNFSLCVACSAGL